MTFFDFLDVFGADDSTLVVSLTIFVRLFLAFVGVVVVVANVATDSSSSFESVVETGSSSTSSFIRGTATAETERFVVRGVRFGGLVEGMVPSSLITEEDEDESRRMMAVWYPISGSCDRCITRWLLRVGR